MSTSSSSVAAQTTTSTQPVRFAVIGCGSHAQRSHLPNIANSSRTVLHTCCDVSDDTLELCKSKFGAANTTKSYEDAIRHPEVEAVVLATTEKLRLPVIRIAAEAGKPVYVEKPLAKTLEEMYEIQKVVEESGIKLCVGHNRRSAPAMIDAHQIFRKHMTDPKPVAWRWNREGDQRPKLAEDGAAAINVRINDDWHSWKSWVFDPEQAPHGAMLFEMTHFTDICNWMLDSEPVSVTAMEPNRLNHGIIVTYANGEVATLLMCGNGTFGYPKELYEMFGNGGAVAIDHMLEIRTAGIADAPARKIYPMLGDRHPNIGTEGGLFGWLAKKQAACEEAVATGDQMLQFTGEPDKGHAHQIDAFADEIQGLRGEVCGVASAVSATRVAFAAVRSAHDKRIVELAEL